MSDIGQVDWWVIVDSDAEDRWRASLGQPDIDAWCEAHGWKSTEVISDTVLVTGFKNGRVEVMAELSDPSGPHRRNGFPTRLAWTDYRRPLPEGIAPVNRR